MVTSDVITLASAKLFAAKISLKEEVWIFEHGTEEIPYEEQITIKARYI